MPEWMWIAIAMVSIPGLVFTLWRIYKTGGSIGIAGHTFVVNGMEVNEDNPSSKVIRYVIRRVGELEELIFGQFLRMIAERGADRNHLVEYDDSMYVKQLFHSIVTGGNGSDSWQQIIQTHMVAGDWNDAHPLEYAQKEIWPQMLRSAKNYLNAEYYSSVLGRDGQRYDRWVTNADLVDEISGDDIRDRACRIVASYVEYAQRCNGKGCVE